MNNSFDPQALFADYSAEYISPWQPSPGSVVTLTLRTGLFGVERCEVVIYGRRAGCPMRKDEERGSFAYYRAEIPVGENGISYAFHIYTEDGSVQSYTRDGLTDTLDYTAFWHIIPGFSAPEWAVGAVMYQIYVDRFANGDPSNDVLTDEYCYIGANTRHKDWSEVPEPNDIQEFYGGDLKGVIDHLDYLAGLGIDAIYFNPLFVSPSNHKYDAQDYEHIDPHFGVIVNDGGRLLRPGEDNTKAERYIRRVTDPENLAASDALFAELVKEAHSRNIRVIIDGVFNHCGSFHRWMDRERIYDGVPGYEPGAYISENSPYHSYFAFRDGSWPDNDSYEGWWGHDTLPKLNYDESEQLTGHILQIAKKWVSEPYNADGWRLDVAADLGHSPEVNHRFWRRFREAVREANPEAIVLAEHYGDASDWLNGREWDTVMNYDAFMEPVTWFLTGMEKHSEAYSAELHHNAEAFFRAMTWRGTREVSAAPIYISMNQLSNHDHSRFLTRTSGKVGRSSDLGSAEADTGNNTAVFRQAVVIQMTWPGAPTLYYGDEAGVTGFTDPDDRRTYPWGQEDEELILFHREMIRLHKECACFRKGATIRLYAADGVIAYGRFDRSESVVVIINSTEEEREIRIPVRYAEVPENCGMKVLMFSGKAGFRIGKGETVPVRGGEIAGIAPGLEALVLRIRHS